MSMGTGSTTEPHILERLAHFAGEAARRRVWRTAFAYAAVVFVALQLGEIVFPAFGAPDWAMRLLVVASFLGFPLVLALAWAFDITSSGIQRADPVEGALGQPEHGPTILPRLALLAIIVVTVGGVAFWTVQDTLRAQPTSASGASPDVVPVSAAGETAEEPAPRVLSLAVLPLDDYSEEEGGEYFTAGLHEELISQLSRMGAARVISRTSVVQYDASGKSMPEIASDLGVDGVVEGSVFRDGDRVRVTVQLIHGSTDQHLWANSYDGTLEDAIGLQRTVAQAIAREIQAELFPEDILETPETRIAASPRVQEEYLRGRYEQSRATPDGLEAAAAHFQAALTEDSGFAPAYAGLAGARFLMGLQSTDSLTPEVLVGPEIMAPLQKALALDEDSPEAQAVVFSIGESLGEMHGVVLPEAFKVYGDSASILSAEIALGATDIGRQISRVVYQRGLEDGKKSRVSQTQRLEHARRLEANSEFEAAETLIRRVLEESPGSEEAWDALERLMTARGEFDAVAQIRQERLALNPGGDHAVESLAELQSHLAEAGAEGFWSWQVETLKASREAGKKVSAVFMARAYMGLERTEDALHELEAAVEARDRNLVSLWSDPVWDPLRADPRFRKILADARPNGHEEGFPPGSVH